MGCRVTTHDVGQAPTGDIGLGTSAYIQNADFFLLRNPGPLTGSTVAVARDVVGVIGPGAMGAPIAANLNGAGFPVASFDMRIHDVWR